MKKLSLFLIVFLLLVGGNGFAETLFGNSYYNTNDSTWYYIDDLDPILNPNPNGQEDVIFDGEAVGKGIKTDFSGVGADLENWTGYYLGTVRTASGGANETDQLIEGLMSVFLTTTTTRTFDITTSQKVDNPTISTTGQSETQGLLTITYDVFKEDENNPGTDDLDEPIAGTWGTTNSSELDIYTVKGSSGFALYYVLPSEDEGFWSSIHTKASQNNDNISSISHFTGGLGTVTIDNPNNPPNQSTVPEPGTMILLGFGLISLAGIGRLKIKK